MQTSAPQKGQRSTSSGTRARTATIQAAETRSSSGTAQAFPVRSMAAVTTPGV